MAWFSTRWKAIALAVSLFVAGAVCGAVGSRWVTIRRLRDFPHRPARGEAMENRLLSRLTEQLRLTEDQKEKIRQVLDRSRQAMMDHRRRVGEDLQENARETREGIVEVLTPEQRQAFEQLEHRFFRQPFGGRDGWPRGPRPGGKPRPPQPPP